MAMKNKVHTNSVNIDSENGLSTQTYDLKSLQLLIDNIMDNSELHYLETAYTRFGSDIYQCLQKYDIICRLKEDSDVLMFLATNNLKTEAQKQYFLKSSEYISTDDPPSLYFFRREAPEKFLHRKFLLKIFFQLT